VPWVRRERWEALREAIEPYLLNGGTHRRAQLFGGGLATLLSPPVCSGRTEQRGRR